MKGKKKTTRQTKGKKKDLNYDPFHIPKEDKQSRLQTFSSDIDQQESLLNLKSELSALREEIKDINNRLEKLERT